MKDITGYALKYPPGFPYFRQEATKNDQNFEKNTNNSVSRKSRDQTWHHANFHMKYGTWQTFSYPFGQILRAFYHKLNSLLSPILTMTL